MNSTNPFEVIAPMEERHRAPERVTLPFGFSTVIGEDDVKSVLRKTQFRYINPMNGFLLWCLLVIPSVAIKWMQVTPWRFPGSDELLRATFFILYCGFSVAFVVFICHLEIRSRAKKLASEVSGQIGEETFLFKESRAQYEWRYDSVQNCTRLRGYFVFRFEDIMRPFIIAERAFESAQHTEAAWAWIETRVSKTKRRDD